MVVYGDAQAPLDKDAFVYVFVDAKEMRPIFDIIPYSQLKNWQVRMIVDSTELATAALFTGDTGRFFQVAAFGSYPNIAASVALAINRNWKYMFGEDFNYWYSIADRLSIKLGPDEIDALGWRRTQMNPVAEEPGVEIPEGFITFRHRSGGAAPLSLWMENRDSIIGRMLNDEGIMINLPVERLFLNLYPVENNLYKAEIFLQINSYFLWDDFSLVPSDLLKKESVLYTLFFTKEPERNGNDLEFESVFLSADDLTSLLSIFIKHWK